MTKLVFNDEHHASSRLHNTVIMLEGEPVFVRNVRQEGRQYILTVQGIRTGERLERPLKDFDLTPVQVGNYVVEDRFQFVTRLPVRRWKQGLCQNHLHVYQMPWNTHHDTDVRDQNLANAIINNYDNFDDAYDKVKGGLHAVPFSRTFGVGRGKEGEIILTHRHNAVGWVDDKGIVIDKPNFYLQEQLVEVLNA